jgi:dCTP deaminase
VLADQEIRRAMAAGELSIDPFEENGLQAASYDLRVGRGAYLSSAREMIDVTEKGLVAIDPGDFAVVETLEKVSFGDRMAALLGLRSEYARQGLLMLSGPQIDPGFRGVLVVRFVNLSPKPIALAYEAPFLSAQLFRLAVPAKTPYRGSRQDQSGIDARDIQELTQTEDLTLGEMMKTLNTLAVNVSDLRVSVGRLEGSVGKLTWVIPAIIAAGIAIIAITVGLE